MSARRGGRLLRRGYRAWHRAAAGMWRRKLPTALTAGVVAASLALVGLVRLGGQWAESAAASWGSGTHMVVYMHPGAGPDAAREVARTLEALASVERADYVSPDEAMKRLERAFRDEKDALLGVEASLLPASVEVSLAGGAPDAAAARALEARLAGVEVIEEIEVVGDWVARLEAAARGLRTLGSTLFLFAVAVSAFVVAAALELGLRARRRERSLLEVLGASPMAARAPVIIEGGLLGVVGAAAAVGVTLAAWDASRESAAALMGKIFGHAEAGFLAPAEVAALLAAGAVAGLVGGSLASRRGGAG